MTEEFIAGVVGGFGWGLFVGGIIGGTWALRVLREFAYDTDDDTEGRGDGGA